MKNLYLIALMLVGGIAIAQDAPATESSSKSVKFGLKAGLNFAKLTNTEGEDYDVSSRTGLNAGAYVHYQFSEKFAFQPELLYTNQGIIEKGTSSGYDVKLTYKLDYIAVPLMIKFYPIKNLNVEFGPQLAFNVKKDLEAKVSGLNTQTYDLDTFFKDNGIDAKTNTFDLGLNFGLGYELDNGLNFGARYSLGMIKVFEGDDVVDENGNAESNKNSVFSFGLGYTFN